MTRAPTSVSLSIGAVLLCACGAATHDAPVVAWPPGREPHVAIAPPSPVAAEAPLPSPPVAPQPPPAPRDGYEERASGVHVREGEAQGLGFLEIVLGDVDPTSELPLVVVIHGRGDRPRVPGGPFAELARPVRVVMPRGPMIVGEGFGWLPVRVADGQTELLAAALRDMSARLARLVGELRAARATRGPTIVTGFSQGGMLTIALAVHHPESVGVAFPLAGWLPPPLYPSAAPAAGAPPIRTMHARDDERIPYALSIASYEHLRTLGWDLEIASYDGAGHAMSPEMDAVFHGWLELALDAIENGAGSLVAPRAPAAVEAAAVEDAPAVETDVRARPARGRRAQRVRRAARARPTADPPPRRPRSRPPRPHLRR